MQLMPGTAGDLGVNDPFEPSQNIRGGAYYLANLLKNYAGDERRALAAYNAGPANVDKYGGVPPFDETRVYVDRVAVLRDRYKKAN
jgi:soluble lytic murein transglycosylase-like protein